MPLEVGNEQGGADGRETNRNETVPVSQRAVLHVDIPTEYYFSEGGLVYLYIFASITCGKVPICLPPPPQMTARHAWRDGWLLGRVASQSLNGSSSIGSVRNLDCSPIWQSGTPAHPHRPQQIRSRDAGKILLPVDRYVIAVGMAKTGRAEEMFIHCASISYISYSQKT